MAKPLRERSLGEPPAPPPAPPACGAALAPLPAWAGGGGGVGALVLRGDPPPTPRRVPRLSCACPAAAPPPNLVLYRCGLRAQPPAPLPAAAHERPTEAEAHAGPVANGHPPGGAAPPAPGPEQELGARLRRLGDAFQRTYEQQRERRGGAAAALWGHLHRLVSQLLGAICNLGAEGA